MPSAYDDIDSENPGVVYASSLGVDVTMLHEKVEQKIAAVQAGSIFIPPPFNEAELLVLKACVEVACGF
jgi:hypothetical protein